MDSGFAVAQLNGIAIRQSFYPCLHIAIHFIQLVRMEHWSGPRRDTSGRWGTLEETTMKWYLTFECHSGNSVSYTDYACHTKKLYKSYGADDYLTSLSCGFITSTTTAFYETTTDLGMFFSSIHTRSRTQVPSFSMLQS